MFYTTSFIFKTFENQSNVSKMKRFYFESNRLILKKYHLANKILIASFFICRPII